MPMFFAFLKRFWAHALQAVMSDTVIDPVAPSIGKNHQAVTS